MDILSDKNHTSQCVGEDTAMCSVSLNGNDATVLLTISISVNGTTSLSPKMQISSYHLSKNCILIYSYF